MNVKSSPNTFKCRFKSEYTINFPWVKEDPNNTNNAQCTLCKSIFSLSNMGKQALVSHAKSKRHITSVNIKESSLPITSVLRAQSLSILNVTNVNKEGSDVSSQKVCPLGKRHEATDCSAMKLISDTGTKENQTVEVIQETHNSIPELKNENIVKPNRIQQFFKNESVSVAEIIWILHSSSQFTKRY